MLCRSGSSIAPLWPAAAAFVLSCSCLAASAHAATGVDLIPQPVSIERGNGCFQIDGKTVIVAHRGSHAAGKLLRQYLARDAGIKTELAVHPLENDPDSTIELRIDPQSGDVGGSGYHLRVSREGVVIRAVRGEGLIYGCQTLRQLLLGPGDPDDNPAESLRLPCVAIKDFPRFAWRGLMLDCSRTFQSVDYIKKTIDRMVFYKMNVLHLHLTDDQGWRIEIEKYPELTRKGARFPARWNEPPSHEGFYTQKEMGDLVRYAAARNITIVPEIEMPGHCLAALSCHPELSCTGGPFEIFPFFKGPGINKDIFCAGSEKTFRFIEDVLSEVFEIFPSQYIHIGGDEAPKHRWAGCARCRERMDKEGLDSEQELQSYFIKRVERFVSSRGRTIIGWDEILEGGLAPNAAVMSWRGMKGGIAAAKAGHDVVMSPTSHCYFDYTYDRIDTRKAYLFEPVPEELEKEGEKHILGLQANFWSHIDREPDKVDSQLFPRLLSVAERGWSPKEVRDWDGFSRRVKAHRSHLERMGVRAVKKDE